jgi:hypothetical protein
VDSHENDQAAEHLQRHERFGKQRPREKRRHTGWKRRLTEEKAAGRLARVTKIDPRLASSVEFATEVSWIELCQKARSPANAKPAARSSGHLPASAG